MGRSKLSVAIITYNEEDIIERCIRSVQEIADQIVVVDSGSTDRTREIAQSLGAEVYTRDFDDFSSQKNFALEKCRSEWILFLDADEIVTDELRNSIKKALEKPEAEGYKINRRLYYFGDILKHAFQPEWRLRLVKRNAEPRWTGRIHEELRFKGKVGYIKGDLIHYSYKSFRNQLEKSVRFAHLVAMEKYKSGKRATLLNLLLNPVLSFFRELFLRKLFLDGKRGVIFSLNSAVYTFMKYLYIYEMTCKQKEGKSLWKREDAC